VTESTIDPKLVLLGLKNLDKYGFNRALYICHAMKIFDAADNLQRKSYIEGVIVGGIVFGFENMVGQRWKSVQRIVLAGRNSLTSIYEILLKDRMPNCAIMTIATDEKHSFAVQGFINIFNN